MRPYPEEQIQSVRTIGTQSRLMRYQNNGPLREVEEKSPLPFAAGQALIAPSPIRGHDSIAKESSQ
jgi:hypothetical protein